MVFNYNVKRRIRPSIFLKETVRSDCEGMVHWL